MSFIFIEAVKGADKLQNPKCKMFWWTSCMYHTDQLLKGIRCGNHEINIWLHAQVIK